MKKITLIFGIICLAIVTLNAENDSKKSTANSSKCAISGIVKDKNTGEPLTGVEVKLADSDIKLYTDFDGRFEIKNVNAGTHNILINFISYKGISENVKVEPGSSASLAIEMKSVEK
jgi:hypothetical protein